MRFPFYDVTNEGAGFSGNPWDQFVEVPINNMVEDAADTADNTNVTDPAQSVGEPAASQQAGLEGEQQADPQAGQSAVQDNGSQDQKQPPAQGAEPAQQPTQIPWEEAIKAIDKSEVLGKLGDPREILKALGVSDFIIDMSQHYNEKGNVDEYLKARAINYDSYTDEQIFREKINREHPTASEKVREKILATEMAKYEVAEDVDGPEDIELKNYLKAEDAKKIREALKAEQAKFQIPSKTPEELAASTPKAIIEKHIAEQQKLLEQEKEKIEQVNSADPRTQQLVTDRKVKLHGDSVFEVPNVDQILRLTTLKEDFFDLFRGADGRPDLNRWYKVAAFATNIDAYEKALYDLGRSAAVRQELEENGHANIPSGTPASNQLPRFWDVAKPVNNY